MKQPGFNGKYFFFVAHLDSQLDGFIGGNILCSCDTTTDATTNPTSGATVGLGNLWKFDDEKLGVKSCD